MSRVQGITFNYRIKNDNDVFYHYSCRFLNKDTILNEKNPLAPKLDTKIFNIKYRTKPLDTDAKTILELIEFVDKNGIKTKSKQPGLIKHANYERKKIYKISEVLPYILPETTNDNDAKINFDGDFIKMNSQRYSLFKESSVCCCCGLKGEYFAKERARAKESTDREIFYHLNLYGRLDGREILLTKDHIKPKSIGGEDIPENYQTMCLECNNLKGNDEISLDELRERVKKYRHRISEQIHNDYKKSL